MNQGGEQGRDDYGLPPVDVEIPDDARELYRDVQAYHRELRALRRHERSMRWRAPFRRSGIAIPLLAGFLIVALIGVMVSAMFTQNPYFNGASDGRSSGPGAGAASLGITRSPKTEASSQTPTLSPSGPQASPAPSARSHLPGGSINVAGKPVSLRTLFSAALAIVPRNCGSGCTVAVRQLLLKAESVGVIVYLVGPRGSKVADLDRLITPRARQTKSAKVATDYDNVLTSAYRTAGFTVLLVDAHGLVIVHSGLGSNPKLEKQLQSLKPAG